MGNSDLNLDKAFRLQFKLGATSESIRRFSLLLKLPRWRLRFESEPEYPGTQNKRNHSVKSRFVRIFQKLRSRFPINGRSAPHLGVQFKLIATPNSLHRFSLLLILRQWRLRAKSEPGSPGIKTELTKRNGSIKSRFVRIFQKLQSCLRIKGRAAPIPKPAKFSLGWSPSMKCGTFLAISVLGFAFGLGAMKILECVMNSCGLESEDC